MLDLQTVATRVCWLYLSPWSVSDFSWTLQSTCWVQITRILLRTPTTKNDFAAFSLLELWLWERGNTEEPQEDLIINRSTTKHRKSNRFKDKTNCKLTLKAAIKLHFFVIKIDSYCNLGENIRIYFYFTGSHSHSGKKIDIFPLFWEKTKSNSEKKKLWPHLQIKYIKTQNYLI